MGRDDLPAFPTPRETFGAPPRSNSMGYNQPPAGYGVPPPPQPRYGSLPGPGQPMTPMQPPPPPPPQQYQQPPPPGPSQHQYHSQPQYPPTFNYQNQQQPPPPPPPSQSPYVNGQPSTYPRHSPRQQHSRMNLNQQQQQQQPPPPRSTSPQTNLAQLFHGVDRNGNGTLSEAELGSALVNGDYTKFNRETVKLMIKMFDRNNDGAIDYEEFGNLWRYLRDWRKIFDKFDLNRNGSISYDEYVRALNAFGYSLSNQTIHYMYSTYSHRDRWGERSISFDMFVQSCICLKRITDSFKKFDTNRDGYITVGFEQYLTEVLSLR